MSKEIPYQPMHQRKHVSHARMLEILAKHSKATPVANEPLKWRRASEHAMESEDGLFRVIREPDPPRSGYRYMAFTRTGQARCLGRFDSFAAAKLGCETYAAAKDGTDDPCGSAQETASLAASGSAAAAGV